MRRMMAAGEGEALVRIRELLGRELNHVEGRRAPPYVYVAGPMPLPIPEPRVAVVGTRNPSAEGLETAERLAEELANVGVVVVSGLARGIDAAAHRAVITAGGRTVAVLGTPLDRFYPPENRDLQLIIMREHLAVSQFPPGHITRRADFVIRNRLMALIADATVVVEAGERSGTISQGWEAIRLGRPLYIWTGTFESRGWAREMARYGARRLDWKVIDELLDELPSPSRPLTVEDVLRP